MKNKIEDLRNHLFETLEALKDEEAPMDIERAKAIADVGKVIVDSAKVEVAFVQTTGKATGSGFFPDDNRRPVINHKFQPPEQPPRSGGPKRIA